MYKGKTLTPINSLKGMTLVETIITMIIVIVLAALLLWMIVSAKNMQQASATRVGNRQDIQIITSKIADELKDSSLSSISTMVVTPATPPNLNRVRAISFISAYDKIYGKFQTDPNGSGKPYWQKYVIYYILPSSTRLLRKEVEITPTLTVSQRPISSIDLDGKGRTVSQSVAFELDASGNYNLTLPRFFFSVNPVDGSIIMNITVRSQNLHGKFDEQTNQVKIFILN